MTLSKPLSEIKTDLLSLLDSNDVTSSISDLQQLLPNNAEKKSQTLLLEGRLNQITRDHNVTGIISLDDYQLEVARIKDVMIQLVNGLDEKDFDPAAAGTPESKPVTAMPKFVIIYDIADSEYCKMLNKHLNLLKIMKKIRVYNVHEYLGGEDPIDRAMQEMTDADYLLVLITVNFFNAPDWFELFNHAMGEGRRIILIHMEQTDHKGLKLGLENLDSFPTQNRAVTDFIHLDHAYTDIVTGIRKLLPK